MSTYDNDRTMNTYRRQHNITEMFVDDISPD
jgi:hypothetical protein